MKSSGLFCWCWTKTKAIISDFGPENDKKKFYSSFYKCYIAVVSYLQNNPPFKNKITEYSQNLHPQERNCGASTSSICNLCLKIVQVFGSKAPKIFKLPLDSTSDSIVDVMENVPTCKYNRINVHSRKWNKEKQYLQFLLELRPWTFRIISREACGRK